MKTIALFRCRRCGQLTEICFEHAELSSRDALSLQVTVHQCDAEEGGKQGIADLIGWDIKEN